jgi:hypothetical protein
MRLALSVGPNRVGVSLSSPEDGNKSSFRDVFSTHLEIRDNEQSPETQLFCYATLSEHFFILLIIARVPSQLSLKFCFAKQVCTLLRKRVVQIKGNGPWAEEKGTQSETFKTAALLAYKFPVQFRVSWLRAGDMCSVYRAEYSEDRDWNIMGFDP